MVPRRKDSVSRAQYSNALDPTVSLLFSNFTCCGTQDHPDLILLAGGKIKSIQIKKYHEARESYPFVSIEKSVVSDESPSEHAGHGRDGCVWVVVNSLFGTKYGRP